MVYINKRFTKHIIVLSQCILSHYIRKFVSLKHYVLLLPNTGLNCTVYPLYIGTTIINSYKIYKLEEKNPDSFTNVEVQIYIYIEYIRNQRLKRFQMSKRIKLENFTVNETYWMTLVWRGLTEGNCFPFLKFLLFNETSHIDKNNRPCCLFTNMLKSTLCSSAWENT